ncbi:MAG TPA: NAD-dependent epimerase/dehydratase family protein [Dyella sp.]
MRILVTGTAGFIGAALAGRRLARGDEVDGIDNHNDYYDPTLKEARLTRFAQHPNETPSARRPGGRGCHERRLCGLSPAARGEPRRPGWRALFA